MRRCRVDFLRRQGRVDIAHVVGFHDDQCACVVDPRRAQRSLLAVDAFDNGCALIDGVTNVALAGRWDNHHHVLAEFAQLLERAQPKPVQAAKHYVARFTFHA